MKLAEYLSTKDMSPTQFAEVIGNASTSAVRKWIADERIPRRDQMERIMVVTDGQVMPNDFFDVGSHADQDDCTADTDHGNDSCGGFRAGEAVE